MHGAWIERYGRNKPHPKHGYYEYDRIVDYFSQKGFIVISEARSGNISTEVYARKIASQIKDLLNQGVPPQNITIIGHSKGGIMTLIVASLLENPKINYVVMAGCGKKGTRFRPKYEEFLSKYSPRLSGKILSTYDSSDRVAGSCQEAFDKAKNIKSKEVILNTGKGHGIFYYPDPNWTKEIIKWSENQ